jgi:hypothetical protein
VDRVVVDRVVFLMVQEVQEVVTHIQDLLLMHLLLMVGVMTVVQEEITLVLHLIVVVAVAVLVVLVLDLLMEIMVEREFKFQLHSKIQHHHLELLVLEDIKHPHLLVIFG